MLTSDTMQFCREDGLDDIIDTWTSLDLEDMMQDVDVIQDVMFDVSMGGEMPVYSPLTVDRATQDAMMLKQGLASRTVVTIQKHVVSCHQPPWKLGCSHGIAENRGGADKHGRRYCYKCTSCGDMWNQTRPDLLSAGEDPVVRTSNRCTSVSEKRRSNGYKCRVCGGKKNAVAAQGTTHLCACPRKTKAQRREQPPSVTPRVVIATRVPSNPPVAHETTRVKDTPAIFVKAVRKHPRMKPGGISLCKWRELLATAE
tara:strand:- start:2558 stop:3325 length:768 start_codon:yes stop_codon:yes gene_type:complete